LATAFDRIRAVQDPSVPFTVYYAFKQSEEDTNDADATVHTPNQTASTGWETMLVGLTRAGFMVQGTWPMRTERGARSVSIGTNALASSIILACRPRPSDAPLATRREFLLALKRELPDALKHLQRGSIAPVDLAQAAIGPGMAVFTRYSKVMEADGSPMKVRQALSLINQTLDEVLAEQEGEFDTDTRWAVAWFEQFGMEEGAFGMAETLSKAKNTAINGLEEGGIIHAKSGKVRLLKREELSADWDPATDNRVSAWEVTQYLIHALETGGETAAATLLRKLGGLGETARDLAYRLFHICERKGWASEAISYNGLVIAWPELSRLARATPSTEPMQKQTQMF
jgi:putative DNA methylase